MSIQAMEAVLSPGGWRVVAIVDGKMEIIYPDGRFETPRVTSRSEWPKGV